MGGLYWFVPLHQHVRFAKHQQCHCPAGVAHVEWLVVAIQNQYFLHCHFSHNQQVKTHTAQSRKVLGCVDSGGGAGGSAYSRVPPHLWRNAHPDPYQHRFHLAILV